MKVTLVGAGSREFAGTIIRDLLLSDPLAAAGLEIVLMDIVEESLAAMTTYAERVAHRLGRVSRVSSTTDLTSAVSGAAFVVVAVERNRYHYWSQDFAVPRKYGFRQVFGENGGPGGLFHALRQFGPVLEIARAMEVHAPEAVLLNFSNPEHKVCEAITRLTSVRAVGLCGGYVEGRRQVSEMLEVPLEHLDLIAAGINHFTWFSRIRDRRTGEDLYPRLREVERDAHWVSDWYEIGLSRILFRRFGLWPSPGANHIGEYLAWAEDYVPTQLQFFHDPADTLPTPHGPTPEWFYGIGEADTNRPLRAPRPPSSLAGTLEDRPLQPSPELAVPIMEWLSCGVAQPLPAVNVPNRGAIPGLPDDMIVEVPGHVVNGEVTGVAIDPLPEGILALLRLQGSIQKLAVEAYAEKSKTKLLQAVLIDPVVDSHNRAVAMVDELLRLQEDALPRFT